MKASPQVNSATGKLPQRSESFRSEVAASWRRCMPAPSITPAAALLQRARAMRLYDAMTSGASTPRRPMALWSIVGGRDGVSGVSLGGVLAKSTQHDLRTRWPSCRRAGPSPCLGGAPPVPLAL